MKKILFPLVAIFISNVVIGQSIILRTNNPEPRVGQVIHLEIYLNPLDSVILHSLDTSFIKTSKYGCKYYQKDFIAKKSGILKINPFSISIGKNTFTSNELILNVLPPLPDEECLWIRFVKNENKNLIILEQKKLASLDIEKGKERGVPSTQIKISEDTKYAELKYTATPDITYNYLSGFRNSLDNSSIRKDSKKVFTYTLSIYEIQCLNFENYRFDLTHVVNLPKNNKIASNQAK